MPGRILPDDLLRRWTREGKTDREMLDLLEDQLNISVTRQAISAWRKRRGMEMNSQPPQAMPWRLRPQHRAAEPARAIRLYARRERVKVGRENPAHARRLASRQQTQQNGTSYYIRRTVVGCSCCCCSCSARSRAREGRTSTSSWITVDPRVHARSTCHDEPPLDRVGVVVEHSANLVQVLLRPA